MFSAAACGEDKGYGDPITDPAVEQAAVNLVSGVSVLVDDKTNDGAVVAADFLSSSLIALATAKLATQVPERTPTIVDTGSNVVDEACVTTDGTLITYDNCDFGGVVLDGTASQSGDHVEVDVTTSMTDPEFSLDANLGVSLTINDQVIVGHLSSTAKMTFAEVGGPITSSLSAEFDVALDNGCPIGGFIEINMSASAQGQSESVWVKADYGPACGDVTVR